MIAAVRHPRSANFAANLAAIRSRVDAALSEAGSRRHVEVVAVSKTQDDARIREALAAGHRVFGENRVQEAKSKWPPLRLEFPDIELRLIGPLQSNKAAEAISLFDVIETVDRPKIARALADEASRQNKDVRFLVQVNTGAEPQKAGVPPENADAFIRHCRDEASLPVEGLMCIPPADEPPAAHFALLSKIAARNALGALSMGMSGDYEIAVQLGATHIRVGTALFGSRP